MIHLLCLTCSIIFIQTEGNVYANLSVPAWELSPNLADTTSTIIPRLKGNGKEWSKQKYQRTQIKEGSNNTCELEVLKDSTKTFSHTVLMNRYNFVYLTLNFNNTKVDDTESVINKLDWVWTYKGENGAHQYLFLPGDFGYLSFGLLWAHTLVDKLRIDISASGNCSRLVIGEKETDKLIGNALGKMTAKIAGQNDDYNSSYWCYNKRVWLHAVSLYYVCKNSVCAYQTFGYKCCRYMINFMSKKRKVVCEPEIYLFGALWWMFPIIIGHVGFAFYPLLLTKIGMKFNAVSGSMKNTHSPRALSTFTNQRFQSDVCNEIKYLDKYQFVSLKQPNPITFISTIFSPCFRLVFGRSSLIRAMRVMIIFLPMTLSILRVCLDFIYAGDVVKTATQRGALVGFSSILVGPKAAREHFLKLFGGPVPALTIYVVVGCFIILLPANLETFLEKGLPTGNNNGNCFFLAQMQLKQKERFSGIQVRQFTGFHRIHHIFICQTFLLLHWEFWKVALKLFYIRMRVLLYHTIVEKLSTCAAVVLCLVVLPFYSIFCLIELVFTAVYFVFPVINCFFILIKALWVAYIAPFENRGCFFRMICNFLMFILFVLFCISWYMYCIIFFDGCWFLSKIAMFTYSGIFAYPKLSYGYIVLAFMALYYLSESLNAFGENYRDLLKLSIEACQRMHSRLLKESDSSGENTVIIHTKYGIPRDLFFLIAERSLPRRNQVMLTILKFATILTILIISVDLIITFDKFQELSLVSHVFSVLFICALPKIIRVICSQSYSSRTRKMLRQKIKKTIRYYVRNKNKTCHSDEDAEFQIISVNGYESLNSYERDTDEWM